MDRFTLIILLCIVVSTYAWSVPFYPVRALHRGTPFNRHVRHARPLPHAPHHFRAPSPVREATSEEQQEPETQWDRPKREHDHEHDHDYDHDHERSSRGVTGPVHTFVKTDKNANYKWGVRHHVGNKYAS